MYDASHENIPLKFTWVHFTLFGGRTPLTTEASRAIDLLQERRTALISAAVTGQIDVRTIPILTPLENIEAFRGKGKGGAVAELLLDRQADREKETHSGYTVQVS